MASSTTTTLLAPNAAHSCARPSRPEPSRATVTGPPKRLPIPISSGATGLSLPSSVPSPITSVPLAIILSLVPVPYSLDKLRFSQTEGELLRLLLRAISLDPFSLNLGLRDEEGLEVDAVLRGRDAEVAQRPGLHFLLRRHHDLPQLRVARLAQLIADGDDARRGGLDRLKAVQ